MDVTITISLALSCSSSQQSVEVKIVKKQCFSSTLSLVICASCNRRSLMTIRPFSQALLNVLHTSGFGHLPGIDQYYVAEFFWFFFVVLYC